MSRTRVKFCGMTRVEDAMMAAAMGVDAVGMVFTSSSRRFLAIDRARAIRAAMPPFVDVVALFRDDEADWIAEVIAAVRPDILQFHGEETAAACAAFGMPYVKAFAMGGADAPDQRLGEYADAAALLLDGHAPGEGGGSGHAFDWARVPSGRKQPLVLAGGLHADNVGEAIARVRPWAVDVASGIEASPGVKDAGRMRAFIDAVRVADHVRGQGR